MLNTIKTFLYMGSLHGFFTFYFPFQLASHDPPFINSGLFKYSAVLFWILGAWIIIHCSADIIRRGGGTPAHLDPPKSLISNGWYRHVRNPIYLGALIVQVGYIIWFGSVWVTVYSMLAFLGFHFLIVVIEEPWLRHNFGAAYEDYIKRVPRWIPRLSSDK